MDFIVSIKVNSAENELQNSQINCQQLESKLSYTEEQLRETKNKVDHCQGAMKALEDSLTEAKEKVCVIYNVLTDIN